MNRVNTIKTVSLLLGGLVLLSIIPVVKVVALGVLYLAYTNAYRLE